MRLSAFAVIAASAALVQVCAAPAPLRLLVVTSSVEEDSPLNAIRFGHAVPAVHPYRIDRELLNTSPSTIPAPGIPISPGGKPVSRPRTGCHGKKAKVAIFIHKIKIKAIRIGNCFRKALGWPLIEVKHHHHHHHGHHHGHPPHAPTDGKDMKDEEAGGTRVDNGFVNILPFPAETAAKGGHWDMSHDPSNLEGDHKFRHFHTHHGSFLSRLHHSLMNLGRWEGRAVAFVIGCGIGVLIRMFWVLAIVSYRAFRGHRDDGYATVAVMEEYDSDDETVISVVSSKTGPPQYIYPVDEKNVDESD